MAKGLSQDWVDALAKSGVKSYLMARLDFANESVFVWTGPYPIRPSGTGDAQLDNQTFLPLIPDVVVDVSANTYSLTDGADAMTLTLGISSTSHPELAAAEAFPDEYQSRPAIIWRCMVIELPTLNGPAQYAYRRIRTGSMDQVIVQDDGESSKFVLTIEGFATFVTNSSQSNYLSQQKFDPTDRSQEFAIQIANGEPTPMGSTSVYGAGSGFGSNYSRVQND
jgi:hypothetical protein